MGTIWVKEFTGGLDTRRMPETTSGGVLIVAKDGHITRGGEFEKRAAFVKVYQNLANTVGLAATRAGLVVFGSGAPPALPEGIAYQQIQSPNGSPLARVPSWDLYSGKLYVVGQFLDGSRQHYYDGARVLGWYDGRARASFRVVGGNVGGVAKATATIQVTGGQSGDTLSNLNVNGVAITNGPIVHTGNNGTTAQAIANAINAFTSNPDYTATASSSVVTITAATPGESENGKAVNGTVSGDFEIAGDTIMSGGGAVSQSYLNEIRVNGVLITAGQIAWSQSNEATASAVAASINTHVSNPNYSATVAGDQVSIVAETEGAGPNGYQVSFNTSSGFQVSPTSLTLQGGSDNGEAFTPGAFVATIGSKVYSVSGPNLHFSGIQQPTKWSTDTVGAGFIDMSSQASGSEELIALARYQNFVAVFAEKIAQIWYIDPNPELNRVAQILNNTGTISPRSVTQFGDNDLFYVDETGVRSLRARDSSNSAATTDTGVPIDTILTEKLRTLNFTERQNVIGLIEPLEGRFWLIVKDVIYVFSFFSGAKVSAWSTYEPGFVIDDAVVYQRRVYLRSGNDIYVYGGLGAEFTYDDVAAEAWLPYLDANAPTRKKDWNGVDAALEGEWEVRAAMDPTNLETSDLISNVYETTYNSQRISMGGASTHVSLRFKSRGEGYARLGAAVIHFEGKADED